jgi:hypothetical protein
MKAAFGIGDRFECFGVWQHVHCGGPLLAPGLADKFSKGKAGRGGQPFGHTRKRPPRWAAFDAVADGAFDQRE